ncbi:ROS1 protein [Nymphaea thermarum]|nr:ROS1 protein [Nymphaea thermarum]
MRRTGRKGKTGAPDGWGDSRWATATTNWDDRRGSRWAMGTAMATTDWEFNYELPDNHPLVEGFDKRELDDPYFYFLAIWTPEAIHPMQVFVDHESSLNPIAAPRALIWNLRRRTVYFGMSLTTIFRVLIRYDNRRNSVLLLESAGEGEEASQDLPHVDLSTRCKTTNSKVPLELFPFEAGSSNNKVLSCFLEFFCGNLIVS